MKRVMGWKKDKRDERDFLFPVQAYKVPDFFVIGNLAKVRDQGNVGSCVGFGIGGALTTLAKLLNVYEDWFSPTWIYNGARLLNGDLKYDVGAYPRLAFKFLKDHGCLLEDFRPYKHVFDPTDPLSWGVEKEAAKWPLFEYTRVVDGVEGLCQALALGQPVALGSPWFYSWMDIGSDGMLPERYDSIAGGHATYLYGFDRVKKVFFGQNSWGEEWGDRGRFQMPFSAIDAFKQNGGYDAYIVKVTWTSEEPVINKEPSIWTYILLAILAGGFLSGVIYIALKFFGVI